MKYSLKDLKNKIKTNVVSSTEQVNEILKSDRTISFSPSGVRIFNPRSTKQTIKWRAKNH